MATVLGLAAQIEREFVSQRTKEALAAHKKAGMVLGRHKLDDREMEIRGLLDKRVNKRINGLLRRLWSVHRPRFMTG